MAVATLTGKMIISKLKTALVRVPILMVLVLPASVVQSAFADEGVTTAPTPATTPEQLPAAAPPAPTAPPKPQPEQPASEHGGSVTDGSDQTVPTGKKDKAGKGKGKDSKKTGHSKELDKKAGDSGLFGLGSVKITPAIIDQYDVPPAWIPIIDAAAAKYGVQPELLMAILRIESLWGSNQGPSSAGAVGHFQFLPSTWKTYGTDADKDRLADPFDPLDAAYSAAKYLTAAGVQEDLDKAIFAYNHDMGYVKEVKRLTKFYARRRIVTQKIAALMQAIPPVQADGASYEDLHQPYVDIHSDQGAQVVAVTDGKIEAIDTNEDGSKRVLIRDVWDNIYIYSNLTNLVEAVPNPKLKTLTNEQLKKQFARDRAKKLPKPKGPATAGRILPGSKSSVDAQANSGEPIAGQASIPPKERLYANYARPHARAGALKLGQAGDVLSPAQQRSYYQAVIPEEHIQLPPDRFELVKLEVGATVMAGTKIGESSGTLRFSIRPADLKDQEVNPAGFIDQWRKLGQLGLYKASGYSTLIDQGRGKLTASGVLLMSKEQLSQLVLLIPSIEIYPGGQQDIKDGKVDARVLRWILYLQAKGISPTVSSLRAGHGKYVRNSSNVSNHFYGCAADFGAFNGESVAGHQTAGSYTELALDYLLALPAPNDPSELISLFKKGGASLAAGDHADHLHAGRDGCAGTDKDEVTAASVSGTGSSKFGPRRWQGIVKAVSETTAPPLQKHHSKWAVRRPASPVSK